MILVERNLVLIVTERKNSFTITSGWWVMWRRQGGLGGVELRGDHNWPLLQYETSGTFHFLGLIQGGRKQQRYKSNFKKGVCCVLYKRVVCIVHKKSLLWVMIVWGSAILGWWWVRFGHFLSQTLTLSFSLPPVTCFNKSLVPIVVLACM